MLATSSIHKSRVTTDKDAVFKHVAMAQNYHEQCVTLLLPMLHNKAAITDAAFLACSTILRFYEEISGTILYSPLSVFEQLK
jgi:hypothetical protein